MIIGPVLPAFQGWHGGINLKVQQIPTKISPEKDKKQETSSKQTNIFITIDYFWSKVVQPI